MDLYTIGYESRSLRELIRTLQEHEVSRLVDVRDRPFSRKKGFSAMPLFEGLRKAGIVYELNQDLGNPPEVRALWKSGRLEQGRSKYRRLIQNGRRVHVEFLVDLALIDRVAILCYEDDANECHRSVIAEEAVRLAPELVVHHL